MNHIYCSKVYLQLHNFEDTENPITQNLFLFFVTNFLRKQKRLRLLTLKITFQITGGRPLCIYVSSNQSVQTPEYGFIKKLVMDNGSMVLAVPFWDTFILYL